MHCRLWDMDTNQRALKTVIVYTARANRWSLTELRPQNNKSQKQQPLTLSLPPSVRWTCVEWGAVERTFTHTFTHVMEWSGRRTGHRQRSLSKMETTAGGGGNQVLLYSSRQFSAKIQNPHAHTLIRERRGPQGTHTIATIKSALWTTKYLTIMFPWPVTIDVIDHRVDSGNTCSCFFTAWKNKNVLFVLASWTIHH